MSKPVLYIMLGIPGAGKTSIAEYVAEITKAVHISSDQFRKHMFDTPEAISDIEHEQIYDMLDYVAEQILKSGKSVIYDANLNQYVHRQEKYEICKRIGAEVKVIWVKTKPSIAKKRATEKAKLHPEHRPFGNMKPDTFDRLVEQMELPRSEENALVISGDDINNKSVLQTLKSSLL